MSAVSTTSFYFKQSVEAQYHNLVVSFSGLSSKGLSYDTVHVLIQEIYTFHMLSSANTSVLISIHHFDIRK